MKNTIKTINTIMKDYSFQAIDLDKKAISKTYQDNMKAQVGKLVNLQATQAVNFISAYSLAESFKEVLKKELSKTESTKKAQAKVIAYASKKVSESLQAEKKELKELKYNIMQNDLQAVNKNMTNLFGCSVAQGFIDFMNINLLKGDKEKSDVAFIKDFMLMLKEVQKYQGCYSSKKAQASLKAVTKELTIYGIESDDKVTYDELKAICKLAKIDGLLVNTNYLVDIKLLNKAKNSVLILTKAEVSELNK